MNTVCRKTDKNKVVQHKITPLYTINCIDTIL
nr:MAG TPA: hypothetical protein [Caudoviricetes sp.]